MTCFLLLGARVLWLGAAGLLAGLAQAQTPAAMPSPPMDALAYRSALADYQAYKDQPVQPWREANDEVGRIGGWRAYAREAAGATLTQDQPASGVPTPAPASHAPDPHAGHHGAKP